MSVSQTDILKARRALLAKQLQKARVGKERAHVIVRRPESDVIPLSFAQQRMWFLHQWHPDNPAYNIPVVLRMVGPLDVTALCKAFDEIVRRHQVLQMTYQTVDEDTIQVPHPKPSLAVTEVDLGTFPANERETKMQRLIVAEVKQPFDLARDLPLRASLLRLDETEHVLLLMIHHIATDGWSMGVFVRELTSLYQAFCVQQPSPLPDPPIQYADFAAWQREWLQGDVLETQLAYWREHLGGAYGLELPIDRPRPPVQTFCGAVESFTVCESVSKGLKALGQEEKSSLFMTLLAAFNVLLYRYTEHTDVTIGSPIANRNRPEIEGVIGFFVNTLILRSDLSGNPRFRELLGRVREVTLGAYAHQDVPFEMLVEELGPKRDLSRTPLFQVMFALQNVPVEPFDLSGLTLSPVETNGKTAKFDLTLSMAETARGLDGFLEYNTDLFDASTMSRLGSHFQVLLESIVANPNQRIADLPLLTGTERHKLLVEWNDTRTEYPQQQCIHQLFEAQVERTPDAVAVVFPSNGSGQGRDRVLTYRELNRRANQLAHYLQALGVGAETLVSLCVERSVEMIVAILGILKAGGAYVPLNPSAPQERLAFTMQDVQSPVLLVQRQLLEKLPTGHTSHVLCLDTDWETLAHESTTNPVSRTTADNRACVMYTSGSTGRPKGASIVHRGVVRLVKETNYANLDAEQVFLQLAPLPFDASTLEIWGSLLNGARLVIFPPHTPSLEEIGHVVQQHQVTTLWLTAGLFHLMVDEQLKALGGVRQLLAGGDVLSVPHVQRVLEELDATRLFNGYGPTENTTFSTCYPIEPGTRFLTSIPIGRPIANTQAYILDKRLRPVPVGVPGGLYVGGDGVARDYLNHPALTAQAFIPNPFGDKPGARLYRTGDLARYLPDGSIEFLGRIDHQVKIRGFRIEPGEIEVTLAQHPGVQEAVVLALDDRSSAPSSRLSTDKRLVAYVVPGMGQELGVSELRRFLKERLPDYMVPATFVPLEALPLIPSGKVDRRALPEPEDTRPELETAFVAPRYELEEQIAAIWSEVLGIDTIGIDDNFFDLGGESFKAIRVVRKINESVSVTDLFKYPSIRELAAHLPQAQAKSTGLLHELSRPVPDRKRAATLVCIPPAGGSAVMYQPLANALPEDCSLYAVELPGHDFSRRDQDLQPLEKVAQMCVEEIERDLPGPIALYAHCIGGALALEVARLLEQSGVELLGVFLGAHLPSPRRLPGKIFEWLEKIFPTRHTRGFERSHLAAARALGGFTDALDPREQEFVMRNYFHDSFDGLDYYTAAYARPDAQKLRSPILSIMGEMDIATEFYKERFKEWEFFSESVDLATIPQAGHFFAKHQPDELAEIISTQLPVWQANAAQASRSTADDAALPAQAVAPNLNMFFLVALGQLISILGTGLAAFALNVWVLQQTGSVSAYAFVTAITWLPSILLLPIAGAIADRYDRRRIMILSDIVAVCATLIIGLLFWTGTLQIWHVCVLVLVSSAANTFQKPAYTAAISQLVPKRYLGHGNGLVSIGAAAGDLLARLGGAVLMMTIGLGGVILVDVVTFLFAVATLLFVRFPDTLFRKQQEEPLLQEVVKGWQYIIKRRGLVAMVAFFLGLNFLSGMVTMLITPLVLSFGSLAILGAVNTALGIGLFAGGSVMGLWGGTKRRAEGVVSFVMLFGVFSVVMGLRPSPIYPAIGLLGFGFSIAIVQSHWYALLQTKVGLYLQGRVIATSEMLATTMMPLGQVVAGLLADRVFEPLMADSGPLSNSVGRLIGVGPGRGMALLMILVGVIGQVWAILGYRYRPLRFMEDALPDAIPDALIAADKDELQKQADRQLQAKVG